jgi:phosphatidylglycerophosphate synthase
MVAAKRVADFLTISRMLVSVVFVWLGVSTGPESLELAAWLLLFAWTADSLDGPLARRGPRAFTTWVGDHDLFFDIVVSLGLLGYLVGSDVIAWPYAAAYLLLWSLILIYFGFSRSLGMLLQAPIYGWFLVVTWMQAPMTALVMMVWIGLAVAITWPKLPNEIIPGFLEGMAHAMHRDQTPR